MDELVRGRYRLCALIGEGALALGIGLSSLGCSDSGSSESTECQPFGAMPEPIALEHVLAVGRGQDDVIHVLDQPSGEEVRAFEQMGDRLVRHAVLGSGHGTVPGIEYYDVMVEAAVAYSLYLELHEGEAALFVRIPSHAVRSMPGAVGEGEELALLGEEVLADFTLEDLPLDIAVEYLGNLEDGRRVLVTRPSEDWSYEDFRVFLGTKDAMRELPVEEVVRRRDGGSTTIVIMLDGAEATLDFTVEMRGMQFVAGLAMLTLGDGTTIAIDLVDATPDAIAQHTFVCAR